MTTCGLNYRYSKMEIKLKIFWKKRQNALTANKRFGVRRGICSQKVLREFESLSPVRTFVFPRPNAKPPTVVCQPRDIRAEMKL